MRLLSSYIVSFSNQTSCRYLFSFFGARAISDDIYKVFEALHLFYLGVHWGVRAARQAMVAIANEHIMPNDSYANAQRAQAESSDHSVAVENSHYAIKYNDVRRLSNFALWEARWVAHEWQKVLGMFGPPLRPLRERALFKEEDLIARVNRVVEETLKDCLPNAIANAFRQSAIRQAPDDRSSSKFSSSIYQRIYLTLNPTP